MKTVAKQEAAQGFDSIGEMVHGAETVVVTQDGKPWIKLVPVTKGPTGKSAAVFKARLDIFSSTCACEATRAD